MWTYGQGTAPDLRANDHLVGSPDPDGVVRSGIYTCSWDLGSCGVGSIKRFGYMSKYPRDWPEKAAFMSEVYKALFSPGMVLYSVARHGDGYYYGSEIQNLLAPLGAHKIHEYLNQCHTPGIIELWMVNIRNAANYYCDIYGDPLPEPPTNYVPHVFKINGMIKHLPKRQ